MIFEMVHINSFYWIFYIQIQNDTLQVFPLSIPFLISQKYCGI